ncbi:MAG: CvpA family protein [Muribaculaceae bacterium]|nr:CvpA family protein [Muribaculaceae bacterium]
MIDLLILFLLIVALWIGYKVGAVKLLGSLCGLLLGMLACHLIGHQCASIAMRWIPDPVNATIVAYCVLFVAIWLSAGLICSAAKKILQSICLGKIDAALGSILLAFMTLAAMSVIINLYIVFDPTSDLLAGGGPLAQSVTDMAPRLTGYVVSHL